MTQPLGEFEGRIVTRAQVAIRKAGDGLSKALKVDPVTLHQADVCYVVLECRVGKVGFDPYDDGVCARVQDLVTEAATIVDGDLVKDVIDAQKERIRIEYDREHGIQELPTQEVLAREHRAGLHEGDSPETWPECPLCQLPPDDEET